jgi:hypothetical protein
MAISSPFRFPRITTGLAFLAMLSLAEAMPFSVVSVADGAKPTPTKQDVAANAKGERISAGTILPVVLRTSVSFEKCKVGQMLEGKIAQNVPLRDGSALRKGSAMQGHILDVAPGANGAGAKVTIQFDKVFLAGQWVPVVTDLRAIAGFVAVQEASVPTEAPGEGSPYDWLPTAQIGGDSVYGQGGPVMSDSKVIGKSVNGGVLVKVSAKEGTNCRGGENNRPQALWVFSGDACGVYGIAHLKIEHAGRTDPKGTIVLASESQKLKLNHGDALLLRVD